MKNITQTTLTMEMQPESIQKTCQTLSSSLEDFLVKLSVLLENEEDFNDTRGTLFFEIARILKDKRPKYFLLENVKGILSHERGETIQTIFRICDELGYDVQWAIYNSKDYGVPQNRERIFIKGYLRRECGSEVLSIPRVNKSVDEPMSNTFYGTRQGMIHKEDEIMNTLACSGHNGGGSQLIQLNNDNPRPQGQDGKTRLYKINKVGSVNNGQGGVTYDPNGISPCLCSGDLSHNGGINIIESKFDKILSSFEKCGNNKYVSTTKDGNCFALTTRFRGMPFDNKQDNYVIKKTDDDFNIRRLTPVECERLQGFPDNFTKYGKDGELISDTQRYKCLGNAVTTNVITAIADEMFEDIDNRGVMDEV